MKVLPKVKIYFPIWKLFIKKLRHWYLEDLLSHCLVKTSLHWDQPMASNVNFPNFATEIHLAYININCTFKYRFHSLSGRAGKYWYNFLLDVEKHHTCIPVCLRSKEFDAVLSNPRNLPLKFRATDWYYQSYSLSDNV